MTATQIMNSNRKCILIVDDEEQIRTLIINIFDIMRTDYQGVTAPDGHLAINRLMQQRFDLVLTDWHMDDMDGLELAKIIRNMLPDMRILLMTGSSLSNLDSKAKSLLAGWIEKPFTPTHILDVIAKALLN